MEQTSHSSQRTQILQMGLQPAVSVKRVKSNLVQRHAPWVGAQHWHWGYPTASTWQGEALCELTGVHDMGEEGGDSAQGLHRSLQSVQYVEPPATFSLHPMLHPQMSGMLSFSQLRRQKRQ